MSRGLGDVYKRQYAEVLGSDGDQLVAEWVLMQAQNAWIQG